MIALSSAATGCLPLYSRECSSREDCFKGEVCDPETDRCVSRGNLPGMDTGAETDGGADPEMDADAESADARSCEEPLGGGACRCRYRPSDGDGGEAGGSGGEPAGADAGLDGGDGASDVGVADSGDANVCRFAERPPGGECGEPDDYEAEETSCDGLDNDCDGRIDEAIFEADALAAGDAHTCACIDDKVACWGETEAFRVDAPADVWARPRVVPDLACDSGTERPLIAAGADHTCALGVDGVVDCVGDDGYHGPMRGRDPVDLPDNAGPVRDLAAGEAFTCAATADTSDGAESRVYCWGGNSNESLMAFCGGDPCGPTAVGDPNTSFEEVTDVAVGAGHACLLGGNGDLRCWGANDQGQLGTGAESDGSASEPTRVEFENTDASPTAVTAGDSHTCAIGQNSGETTAWCWGSNENGQLGLEDGSNGTYHTPQKIEGAPDFAQLEAGGAHTCGFNDETVGCWGKNTHGQTGTGEEDDSVESPDSLPEPFLDATPPPSDLSLGARHTCLVSSDGGAVHCWGSDAVGQLGNGDWSDSAVDSPARPAAEVACEAE